ncbi:MAG: aldo/keto reductase [Deltaproteobacteria bacterium]|nr:aldo/keto reductase [Deltaproteobacteria bacterium]
MLRRKVPSSGEQLPAIGIGSWETFDVDDVAPVQPVLAKFLAGGGRVIDSSPMYGRSEAAIGKMIAAIKPAASPFLATKVWTTGQREGIAQMERSVSRMGAKVIDLMQVHNLVDWKTQLATLREWKAAGKVRYIGLTHYGALDELERVVRAESIDFVQLPYSVAQRGAEKRLLPACEDRGAAVLVMEPFAKGALFAKVKGKALPAVAGELGCTSWAQLFLKFILGHPAVTCPIPATSKVAHLDDNMGAMRGPVPTAAQRAAIVAAI